MTIDTNVTNDVFTPVETPTSVTTPTSETLTGTVAELVGEGKKYKTLEALAASVQYANEHIARLEAEAKAREKAKADEVFEKLLTTNPVPQPTASLTQEDVTKLITDTLTQGEKTKIEANNLKFANDTVLNHFGDVTKAKEFIANKALELGLSQEFLMSTASKSPTAFLNVVGLTVNKDAVNNKVITNSVNDIKNLNSNAPVGSKEYYDNMFKTDKRKYFSPGIQKEIQSAALKGTYFKQ